MKKLFLYILIFCFLLSSSGNVIALFSRASIKKNFELLFKPLSAYKKYFLTALSLVGGIIIFKMIQKENELLKRKKTLLKFQKKLKKTCKELLSEFVLQLHIEDPNFLENLDKEIQKKEEFICINHGRKRLVDEKIPGKVVDFTDN